MGVINMNRGVKILMSALLIFVLGCGNPPPPKTPADWIKSTAQSLKSQAESVKQATKDIESVLKVTAPEMGKTLGKAAKETKESIEESKGILASAVEAFKDELNNK